MWHAGVAQLVERVSCKDDVAGSIPVTGSQVPARRTGHVGCWHTVSVLLFHHAGGLTPGALGFAERLRGEGHAVHAPDLFEGHAFAEPGHPDYDERVAALATERIIAFLARL